MIKKMVITLLTLSSLLTAAPEAIVFDFGGVMTVESNRKAVVEFLCKSLDLSKEQLEIVNQERKRAHGSGVSAQDFWMEYAQNKNIVLSSDWENCFNSVIKKAVGVNEAMYQLVSELKQKGIRVALLSNIDHPRAEIVRGLDLYEPFSPCLLSCEIGLEKPDLKIYEVLIDTLQLAPASILFIDDKVENVESAQNIGLDALLFTSQEQLLQDLQARGVKISSRENR